jgi:hypothetical protein
VDETDQFVDNLQTQRAPPAAAALLQLPPELRKFVTTRSSSGYRPAPSGNEGSTRGTGSIRAAMAAGMVLAGALGPAPDRLLASPCRPSELAEAEAGSLSSSLPSLGGAMLGSSLPSRGAGRWPQQQPQPQQRRSLELLLRQRPPSAGDACPATDDVWGGAFNFSQDSLAPGGSPTRGDSSTALL